MICCHGKVVFHPLKCRFLMVASKIQNDSLIATQLLFESGCSRRGCLYLSMVPLGCNRRPQRRGDRRTGLKNDECLTKRFLFFASQFVNSGDSDFF